MSIRKRRQIATSEGEALVYTIEEGRKLLKLGRSSMYEAVRRGQIPAIRIGGKLLIPKAKLDELLQQR